MDCIIDRRYDKKTVKEYILGELQLSSKMLTRLKKSEKGILLNGNRVTVRAQLKEGDTLSLLIEDRQTLDHSVSPVCLPVDIIYEDDHYIAANKPSNMPTHPSHDHYDDTLANAISYLYTQRGLPFVFRAVNRLDRDTSGIVIFAKSSVAANAFSRLQQNKLVVKKYLALTDGIVKSSGSIKGYIRRKDNSVMLREFSEIKTHDDSHFSHTDFKLLAECGNTALVELVLHTGKTHQIRVHLSSIKAPVLGDVLYGTEDGYARHMLHAYSIEFVHPFTKKEILIKAPLPHDFVSVMEAKGIKYEL